MSELRDTRNPLVNEHGELQANSKDSFGFGVRGGNGTELLGDPSAIDRGEAPAKTVRQLVSAIRQDLAAGGADRLTLRLALEQGNADAAVEAAERLAAAFDRIDKKATMAMEADRER